MNALLPALVLVASLVGFLARGVIYLPIGSWLPLAFAMGAMAFIGIARIAGQGPGIIAIRVWSVWLIGYGIMGISLALLLDFAPVGSPHALENTGWVFIAIALLHLIAGIYLLRARRQGFGLKPKA